MFWILCFFFSKLLLHANFPSRGCFWGVWFWLICCRRVNSLDLQWTSRKCMCVCFKSCVKINGFSLRYRLLPVSLSLFFDFSILAILLNSWLDSHKIFPFFSLSLSWGSSSATLSSLPCVCWGCCYFFCVNFKISRFLGWFFSSVGLFDFEANNSDDYDTMTGDFLLLPNFPSSF